MTIKLKTSFLEEQTNSFDYDNTYFCPEEASRLDGISSFTTITPSLQKEFSVIQQDTSAYPDVTTFHSDTDDISESITFDIIQYNNNDIDFDLQ